MKMHKKDNEYEMFKYTFDNINLWINNIDNKISILLAFLVAIIGYIFTIENKICLENVQRIILFVAIILLICGCLLSIFALRGRIKSKVNYVSMIYFGSISNMDRKEYFDKSEKINEKQSINDIKNQIYINSCICNKKFKIYNLALYCLVVAISLISIIYIINIF